MTPKQFQKYLDRDGGVCVHCGTDSALVPHHRLNRGQGGSKARDVPSNIIVLCAEFNGLMESNATAAKLARDYGWKLVSGQQPSSIPVWYGDAWYNLDDNFGKSKVWTRVSDDEIEWF